jgi:hypothetical protein
MYVKYQILFSAWFLSYFSQKAFVTTWILRHNRKGCSRIVTEKEGNKITVAYFRVLLQHCRREIWGIKSALSPLTPFRASIETETFVIWRWRSNNSATRTSSSKISCRSRFTYIQESACLPFRPVAPHNARSVEVMTVSNALRFEAFTATAMKNGVFWDVMPCGSCKKRCFGGM